MPPVASAALHYLLAAVVGLLAVLILLSIAPVSPTILGVMFLATALALVA